MELQLFNVVRIVNDNDEKTINELKGLGYEVVEEEVKIEEDNNDEEVIENNEVENNDEETINSKKGKKNKDE